MNFSSIFVLFSVHCVNVLKVTTHSLTCSQHLLVSFLPIAAGCIPASSCSSSGGVAGGGLGPHHHTRLEEVRLVADHILVIKDTIIIDVCWNKLSPPKIGRPIHKNYLCIEKMEKTCLIILDIVYSAQYCATLYSLTLVEEEFELTGLCGGRLLLLAAVDLSPAPLGTWGWGFLCWGSSLGGIFKISPWLIRLLISSLWWFLMIFSTATKHHDNLNR